MVARRVFYTCDYLEDSGVFECDTIFSPQLNFAWGPRVPHTHGHKDRPGTVAPLCFVSMPVMMKGMGTVEAKHKQALVRDSKGKC